MALRKDFRDFVFRGNVVDLAVAVVVGGAFGKIVTALVEDLVMPFVGIVLPSGQWREWIWSPVANLHLKVGHFVGSVVDFVIIAFAIFLVLVKFVGGIKTASDPRWSLRGPAPMPGVDPHLRQALPRLHEPRHRDVALRRSGKKRVRGLWVPLTRFFGPRGQLSCRPRVVREV